MKTSWQDKKLERSAATDKAGTKAFGKDIWAALKRRIASLEAAPSLKDMRGVPGRFHPLSGDRKGQFALTVSANKRLVFEPDHDPVPTLDDGGIDESKVTAVSIVEVVDYHD